MLLFRDGPNFVFVFCNENVLVFLFSVSFSAAYLPENTEIQLTSV